MKAWQLGIVMALLVVLVVVGGVSMAWFWWGKPKDPQPVAVSQPAEDHLVGALPAGLVVDLRDAIGGNHGPEFPRSMAVVFPWGEVNGDRRAQYSKERDWYGYVQVVERRGREVNIDAGRPIADQVLRPEIAADVERAIALMLIEDAKPVPDVWTDEHGRKWQRVR